MHRRRHGCCRSFRARLSHTLKAIPPVVHCEHAARCAGCPQIELAYDAQLRFKKSRVEQAFARYPALSNISTRDVAAAKDITGYRTRVKLVAAKDGALGLFAKGGGHEVVDIPHCRVVSIEVQRVVALCREWLRGDIPKSLRSVADGGRLTAIDVREVRDAAGAASILTLILQKPTSLSKAESASLLETFGSNAAIRSLAVSFVEPKAIQLLGRDLRVIAGPEAVPDQIGMGTTYQLAAHGAFVQANRGQAQAIHERIAEALHEVFPDLSERRVMDLYSGSGALGLHLAGTGARVLLVDSYEPAISQARNAAEQQGLTRVHFYAGDTAEVVRELADADVVVDAVIVNPPRRGVAKAARASIARLAPAFIAYVSCHPETLARDLSDFARMGYATVRASPFDMIPLTDEVETLVILKKARPLSPTILYQDSEIIVVDKAPNEPTTPQGEHAHSLLERVKALPTCRNATPIHRLDEGTSGVCILAKDPKFAGKWSDALQATTASKKYIALVRGVIRAHGTIDRPLTDDGKTRDAHTRYERIETLTHHSLVAAFPEEGRTHQIRRHFESIGHPILGDARYGDAATNRYMSEKHGLDRALLHCSEITLIHPTTTRELTFSAPLAGDAEAVLASIKLSEDSRAG